MCPWSAGKSSRPRPPADEHLKSLMFDELDAVQEGQAQARVDLAVASIVLGADAERWGQLQALRQRTEGVLLVSFEPGVRLSDGDRSQKLNDLIRLTAFEGKLAHEKVGAILWTVWLR